MDASFPPIRLPDMHRTMYPQQQALFDIEHPTNNDVLCGRGVTTNRHVGNENFRSLVNCNKELYVTSTKKQKMRISRSIVDAVRSLQPPGRFLEKDKDTATWYDIGDKKAVEKTSQALRDGAASLRKQLSEDLCDPDFVSAVFDAEASKGAAAPASASKNLPVAPLVKKKPQLKEHRRSKSNPTILSAVKAKVAIKKHKMEPHMSPTRSHLHSSLSHRPPLSPMSPRVGHPMSPRFRTYSVSPRGVPRDAHSSHRRGNSMPMVSYPLPGSPIYRDAYRYSSPGSGRNSSYEWGTEHYEYGPPPSRPHHLPQSPSMPPLQSPSVQYSRHHVPHPFHTNSPNGYGRPQSHSQYQPQVSPRWSPQQSSNHSAPSLSPHPYLHSSDSQSARSPECRPPLGLSPRHLYPRGGNSQFGSASSLSVPLLGVERSQARPLPVFPMRYPPPSPHSSQRQSYRPSSPVRREFSPPPRQLLARRHSPLRPCKRMESPVEYENEYGPEDEEMHDKEINVTKSNRHEVLQFSRAQQCSDKSSSPAAVSDVVSSEEIVKEERIEVGRYDRVRDYREYHDDDYPSDEDPNPATDEMRVSPLPFDLQDDQTNFMELPENLLSMPISRYGHRDYEL